MALTKAHNRMIKGASVNVKDFGAVGDGVADDTLPIRAAILYAYGELINAGGTPDTGSKSGPSVYFPYGSYKITDYLTSATFPSATDGLNYLKIWGDYAAIVPDAGIDVFGGVAYNCHFEGLIIRGGKSAFSIETGNVDSNTISIVDCELLEQTDACIVSDLTSNSSILTVTRCKLIQRLSGGQIFRLPTCDYIISNDNWIKSNSTKAFTIGYGYTDWVTAEKYLIGDIRDDSGSSYQCLVSHTSGTFATDLAAGKWVLVTLPTPPSSPAKLILESCVGVPGGDNVITGGRWGDVHGEIHATNFRFGGEAAGATPFRYYGDGTTNIIGGISMRNCSVFATLNFLDFYALPEFLHIENINGLTLNDGITFDTSITNEEFRVFQENGDVSFDNMTPNTNHGFPFLGSPDYNQQTKMGLLIILGKIYNKNQWQYCGATRRLQLADVLGSAERQATGWAVSGTNVTTTGVDDAYLVNAREWTATADDGNFVYRNDTYLDPTALTSEQAYTLAVIFDSDQAVNGVLNIRVTIAGSIRHVALTGGRQVVSIPFVYLNDTGSADTNMDRLRFDVVDMPSGSKIRIGRQLLLNGYINYGEEVAILTGTADPSAIASTTNQTNSYFRGDIMYHTNVSASGTIGRVCVTEGNAGTWKTFGTVAS